MYEQSHFLVCKLLCLTIIYRVKDTTKYSILK
jgi:hypothetical protein